MPRPGPSQGRVTGNLTGNELLDRVHGDLLHRRRHVRVQVQRGAGLAVTPGGQERRGSAAGRGSTPGASPPARAAGDSHGAPPWSACTTTFGGRRSHRRRHACVGRFGLVPDIKDLEPLIGRWSQVVDAPRHVEEKVEGTMTLEWLRGEQVVLQRSIAENPMFPEGVVLIMAADDDDAEGDFTAHYFDS